MDTGNIDSLENQQINSSQSLASPDEPDDNYSEYLSREPKPTDGLSNPRNLFDDSNSEDQKWLKSAMTFLRRLN